jgi:hypothetical protein
MGAHPEADGGMLGEDLTGGARSVEWTSNLANRANVAVRGVTDKTSWRHVMARGSLDAPNLFEFGLGSI